LIEQCVLNKSIKIFIKWVLGPLLAAWLFYSLYAQVKKQPDLEAELALIRKIPVGPDALKFWGVVFLVFVNWGLEAVKWKLLLSTLERVSFFRAFKSVLCGTTLTLNTPNRIGEYAGRVLFVNEGNRMKAVSLSIAGGTAQLIITVMMGTLGLAFIDLTGKTATLQLGLSVFWLRIFLTGSAGVMLLLLLFFFRLGWLIRMVDRLPFAARFSSWISILETFDAKILLRLLGWSLLRYLVFVFQYVMMLQVLNVEPDCWQSIWLVTVQFWVLAIIPSFAIAELGIRSCSDTAAISWAYWSLPLSCGS
jgi:hypothetical protein